MFKPGQIVVCIDDSFTHENTHNAFTSLPVKDREYTVRDYKVTSEGNSILLEEIVNSPVYFKEFLGKIEPRFHERRFRLLVPLVEEVEELELEYA